MDVDETLPVGRPVPGWSPRPRPTNTPLAGRYVDLVPLDADTHAAALWAAFGGAANPDIWAYIPDGPFADFSTFRDWLRHCATRPDWAPFALVPRAAGTPRGMATFMRMDPDNGVAEIGCIVLGDGLRRTPAATEAIYLIGRRLFDDLGYRRYEWKCNDLNAPSRRAAARFGFAFEGVFRAHMVVKGRNRDTAWFAITDADWPACRAAFESWLAPGNFAHDGRQIADLATLREGAARPASA